MNSLTSPQRFKVVFFGAQETGKTTMVHKLLQKRFKTEYVPTLGVDVHPLLVKTTKGDFILDIWDTAGQQKFGGLEEGYYIAADLGVVFILNTRTDNYNQIRNNKINNWNKMTQNKPYMAIDVKSDSNTKMNFVMKASNLIAQYDYPDTFSIPFQFNTTRDQDVINFVQKMITQLTGDSNIYVLDF